MGYNYNAEEVFEMAIQIEANGAAFYRRAAALQKNKSDKDFLETIARMEDRHKAGFEQMKASVSDIEKTQAIFDPDEEMYLYLKAMADAHGGEGDPDTAARLTGDEPLAQIVETAIALEKESILFYIGLKDIVPPELGKEKIVAIIEDEKKHVAQLSGFLKKAQE